MHKQPINTGHRFASPSSFIRIAWRMGASEWPVLAGKDPSIMKFALIHSNEAKQLMRHAKVSKTKLTPWTTLEPFLRATIELSDLITARPTIQTVMDEVKRVSTNHINFQNASQQAQNSMPQDIMLISHRDS
jgi:hypothetical protein